MVFILVPSDSPCPNQHNPTFYMAAQPMHVLVSAPRRLATGKFRRFIPSPGRRREREAGAQRDAAGSADGRQQQGLGAVTRRAA